MKVTTSADELAALLDRDGGDLRRILLQMLEERARGTSEGVIGERLLWSLGRSIYATQILSRLLGAQRVVLELEQMSAAAKEAGVASPMGVERPPPALGIRVSPGVAGARSPAVPSVEFEEAVARIVSRRPVLGRAYREATARYTLDDAFTMAKAVSEEQLTRVRDAIGGALRDGKTLAEARGAVADLGPWSESYAELVYQNAVSRAYTQGRLTQAKDPDVRLVAPAVMVQGIHDADERPNHRKYVGLVASPDDPIWNVAAPPYGHRCRHGLRLVDRIEAESLGILLSDGRVRPATIPPGAHPDPGWRS